MITTSCARCFLRDGNRRETDSVSLRRWPGTILSIGASKTRCDAEGAMGLPQPGPASPRDRTKGPSDWLVSLPGP
jgi:hypothetical protein